MTGETKDLLKVLIPLPFILIGITAFILSIVNKDKDLSDGEKRAVIYENFEKEFKEIKTPTKTALSKFEKLGGLYKPIVVYSIYRSELPKKELYNYFDNALQSKGWILVNKNQPENPSIYCKGKFQAKLEPPFDKAGESPIYLSLIFSLGSESNCSE